MKKDNVVLSQTVKDVIDEMNRVYNVSSYKVKEYKNCYGMFLNIQGNCLATEVGKDIKFDDAMRLLHKEVCLALIDKYN